MRALFGIDPPLAGSVRVAETEVRVRQPRDAIRAGLALVPEDRKSQGLVPEMGVTENLSLASLRRDRLPGGFIGLRAERELAARMGAAMSSTTACRRRIIAPLGNARRLQSMMKMRWSG